MKRWPLWLAVALLLALATQLPALWRYAVATTMSLHAQDQARQWQSGGRWASPNAQPAQPSLEQWSLASQSIEEAIDVNPDDAQLHEALALLHINHLRWHSPNPAEARAALEQATELLTRANELRPMSAQTWAAKALALYGLDTDPTDTQRQAALWQAFDRAMAYAQRVASGTEVAGRLEVLACRRFISDQARAGSADFPYVLNRQLGSRACRFIELLPHIKGEWAKPVYVDGKLSYAKIELGDWQVFVEFQLFGWVHRDTGLRRFRRSYEEVARKNAKSTRAAARELYLLAADGEPGAHCYSAATTGEQAREVFDVARNMALREPEFLARFGVEIGRAHV
jgi:tetratricopeptide (TPR) repeat protein